MSPIKDIPSELRSIDPYLHIDPGFINRRKCFSVFGNQFVNEFEARRKPGDDWPHSVFNDHLLVDLALGLCRTFKVGTLGEALSKPRPGQLFCSTESLAGNEAVYDNERVTNAVLFPFDEERSVQLEFSPKHLVSDTGRFEQSKRSDVAIVGELRAIEAQSITIHPLIMGAPTFDHPWNRSIESEKLPDLMWHGYDWFQTYPEDIDEFTKVREVGEPSIGDWTSYMKALPEDEVKAKFCTILGDIPKKDWGGEMDDHFSTAVHLSGKRLSAAFAFKGPATFREMTPDLLGKRADQIFRLANTPADLLVVQHCHTIGEAVRATLRAFAVAPHNPRRYCLIDGKDTYKLLTAYDKL